MSNGVNKVILVGFLGNDPKTRYMPNGNAVTNISIATSESWKDKQTGEKVEKTEWHNIAFFNKLAEIVAEYLKKGSQIYVEGRLETKKWKAEDGSDRYTTGIIASQMQMLGSKSDNQQNQGQQKPARQSAPPQQNQPSGLDFDDDIPF